MSGAVDLRGLFFDDPAEETEKLTTAMLGKPGERLGTVLDAMPGAAKEAALSRLTGAAAGLLEQDVTGIFGSAWRKHSAIRSAAEASLAEPDTERHVDVATHAVSFAHAPAVEVRIGDQAIATVTVEIQLDLLIKGLQASIRAGRLVGVRSGVCDVDGSLTVAGMEVAQRQVTLQLPLSLRLRNGWPLLDQVPAVT